MSKHQIQPEYEDEQADAGRDYRTRLARRPVQLADHEQDWQPYPVDPYSCYCICDYRVRLPILHVVSSTEKINVSLSAFAPQKLVLRDGFGSPVPRQPAHLHTQAESGAYLRDSSRVLRWRPFIYLKPPSAIGAVPSLSVPMAFTAASPPVQGQ